jgi:uncharacterized protein (DUF433 family)
MDPIEIDDLVAAYEAGTSIKDLAAQFEINRSTILAHLAEQDISRRYPALNPEEVAEVCELYDRGLSSSEIGQLFEVSADTVLRALRKMGIRTRPR